MLFFLSLTSQPEATWGLKSVLSIHMVKLGFLNSLSNRKKAGEQCRNFSHLSSLGGSFILLLEQDGLEYIKKMPEYIHHCQPNPVVWIWSSQINGPLFIMDP